MGVPWGVEYGETKYDSRESYLDKWKAFCEAGLCRHFVFPIDDVFYEFKLDDDKRVVVTEREDPDLLAAMRALSCGDGTYDMFEMITDGVDLYVPDRRKTRRIDRPEFAWNYRRADSLDVLCGLPYEWRDYPEDVKRLSRELRAAAQFCRKHRLMLGISY